MKYLLIILSILSFNAAAISLSHTVTTGTTNSHYTGQSKGVVDYSSIERSTSSGIFTESIEVDKVSGTEKTKSNYGGYSNGVFTEHAASVNGADFSYATSTENYGSTSHTKTVNRYDVEGFEQHTNSSPWGSSYEREEYAGSFIDKSLEHSTTRGTSTNTEVSWYQYDEGQITPAAGAVRGSSFSR